MASSTLPKKDDSTLKRARQDVVRHYRNISNKSSLKTEEKKLQTALINSPSGTEELKKLYRHFISSLDRAAVKGVIHRNAVNRKKKLYGIKVFQSTN